MFDVGFSELMLIGIVALVVIGPERMPRVARTVGALLGRAQRYVNALKADIESEVDLKEFNRIKSTFYDAAKSIEHSASRVREEFEATAASVNESSPESGAAQSEPPVAPAVDTPKAPVQMDFWLDSTPAAGPPTAPRT